MTKIVALMLLIIFGVICLLAIGSCLYVASKADEKICKLEVSKDKFNKNWDEWGR